MVKNKNISISEELIKKDSSDIQLKNKDNLNTDEKKNYRE